VRGNRSFGSNPGVYVLSRREESNKIKISNKTIAGFIGVARKGPVDEAVRITDFNRYLEIFGGFESVGYLPYSVYTFFNSGGKECYVVRTAHGGERGLASAQIEVPGLFGNSTLCLYAASPGSWGNTLSLRVWHSKDASLEYKIRRGSRRMISVLLGDCLPGDTLRIFYSDGVSDYFNVTGQAASEGHLNIPYTRDDEEPPSVQRVRFNMTLSDGRRTEDFLYMSRRHDDDRYFFDMLEKSRIVRITPPKKRGDASLWFPKEIGMGRFSGGRDGIVGLSAGDFIGYFKGLNDNRGLGIFESLPDVSLLCAPDAGLFDQLYPEDSALAGDYAHAVRRAMIDQAERLGDRFALLDASDSDDLQEVLRSAKRYDSSHAALYYPEIEILDPLAPGGDATVNVPPSGAVAGIIARCDHEEGRYRAPAGIFIPGAVGTKWIVDDESYQMLYDAGVNGMKRIPGRGIKLWGARTLSSDPQWRYINVRRTFSLLAGAIKKGTGWAVFEPNTPGLRKRIVRHVSAFLIDMWRKGYLAGKTPEEAFFIRCDDELNSPEQIDAGIITTMVGLSITKPVEFIVVTLNAVRDDANVVIEEA